MIMLELLALLFIKHFIIDFPLQKPYQYLNKGTYGHMGGILHATLHGVGTMLCMFFFTPFFIVFGVIDAVIHYHIDWVKVKVNKHMGWGPTTHEQFWWLLGADQLLHALTYIGLVSLL